MASTAVTVQDYFSAGMPAIKETANKALVKTQRQLPMRDTQGKFVERNTGLLLGALNKIQSTLGVLVGLTRESLGIQKGEQIINQGKQRDLSLAGAESDPVDIPKEKGPGFMSKGWEKLQGAFGRIKESPSVMLAILLGGLALLSKYSENLVGPLANLLEWFDKNGLPGIEKVLLKAKDWAIDKFFDVVDRIEQFFAKFGKDGEYGKRIDRLLTAMTNVFVFLENTIKTIEDWIASYDVEPGTEGYLDKKELKKMRDDIWGAIWSGTWKFVRELTSGISLLFLAPVLATFATRSVAVPFAPPPAPAACKGREAACNASLGPVRPIRIVGADVGPHSRWWRRAQCHKAADASADRRRHGCWGGTVLPRQGQHCFRHHHCQQQQQRPPNPKALTCGW